MPLWPKAHRQVLHMDRIQTQRANVDLVFQSERSFDETCSYLNSWNRKSFHRNVLLDKRHNYSAIPSTQHAKHSTQDSALDIRVYAILPVTMLSARFVLNLLTIGSLCTPELPQQHPVLVLCNLIHCSSVRQPLHRIHGVEMAGEQAS